MKPVLCLILWLLAAISTCRAQFSADIQNDEKIFSRFITEANTASPDSLMTFVALFFLNTPYVAGTLEATPDEQLVINLREMDCLTLIENCLALARTAKSASPDMQTFQQELRKIRYRNGIQGNYASRLHYTSDWIYDNVKKDIVEDKTPALGGKKTSFKTGFMSNNANKYKNLSNNDTLISEIRKTETVINSRTNYYYIPKQDIQARQSLIRNGDIICFTTAIEGLDISHLGIALWNRNRLTFVHASSTAKKVIVNPELLSDYCAKIKTNTGIIVLHPML